MYPFIKFVHIIAAMVYFGLPIAFGRWLSSSLADPTGASLAEALKKMRMFTLLHLNLCALFILGSGLWLAHERGFFVEQTWVWLSMGLLAATLINLNLNLGPVLSIKFSSAEKDAVLKRLRPRVAWFSASHHTLVTLLVALMVFKP